MSFFIMRGSLVGKKRRKFWRIIPMNFFGCIWKERNWRALKGVNLFFSFFFFSVRRDKTFYCKAQRRLLKILVYVGHGALGKGRICAQDKEGLSVCSGDVCCYFFYFFVFANLDWPVLHILHVCQPSPLFDFVVILSKLLYS